MLVSMKEILDDANKNNYSIIAPNVFTDLEARSAVSVAEEINAPIVLDVIFTAHPDLALFGKTLALIAREAKVPVAINLDHGGGSEYGAKYEALTAIKGEFTSVMIDKSSLSFEDNVKEVKEIVNLVKPLGISVEAEIGHVGSGANYEEDGSSNLTEPEMAKRYVEETGVDCIAVAIGTAHGSYGNHTPYLDFDRLVAIKEATKIPLVLHGGSGTGFDNIKKACQLGINKVNVCNELLACACDELNEKKLSGNGVYNLWTTIITPWKARLKELMIIAGGENKAWVAIPAGMKDKEIVAEEK